MSGKAFLNVLALVKKKSKGVEVRCSKNTKNVSFRKRGQRLAGGRSCRTLVGHGKEFVFHSKCDKKLPEGIDLRRDMIWIPF